ncbi:hypothetical protein [Bacillus nitratireducens]|uniref:hypothetical protein n=1 Tax=Bacillus nitratireducens TaxID=2026193 RepID=UPI001C92C86D|nr:hypothetical protein [Bacillus nitratireducens]
MYSTGFSRELSSMNYLSLRLFSVIANAQTIRIYSSMSMSVHSGYESSLTDTMSLRIYQREA